MQIKVDTTENLNQNSLKKRLYLSIISLLGMQKSPYKIILTVCIILFMYSLGTFAIGVIAQRNFAFSNLIAKPIILDNYDILVRWINSFFTQPEIINIDIKYKDYQKLEYIRQKAISIGTLYRVSNEWVNAKVRYRDKVIPVRLRLKGGIADEHLEGGKWSFRIKVRGDETLFGMKEFAVMSPMRRNLIGEWFIRKVYEKEGIITRKYEFIKVIINGKSKGIYVIDERYDNIMLERNNRREGPVIKIDQAPIFIEKVLLDPIERDDYYLSMDVTAFNLNKFLNNDNLKKQFIKAKDLMERFRLGLITTHEVFDIEKLAKWTAISDVMGAWHGFGFSNMRFYYNPIISKFEPVPDDNYNERAYNFAHPVRLFRLNDHYNKGKFLKQLFSDNIFTERYLHELERISKDTYLDSRFAEFHDEIRRNSYILAKDYPLYNFLLDSKKYTYQNAQSLRDILNPHKGLQAYFHKKTSSGIILKIANNKSIPMEIMYIRNKNKDIFKPKSRERIILEGRYYATPVNYQEYEFDYPKPEWNPKQLYDFALVYHILGTSKERSTEIFPFQAFDRKIMDNDIHRRKPNFQEFDFLTFEPKKKEIVFKKGNWKINKDLIIPKGHTLIAKAGVTIDLVNSAMIFSYSSIVFLGLEDYPVKVLSSDSTGQGITVINAERQSLLKYVIFKNLSSPAHNDWELTGAINFYESPVSYYETHFYKNISGDDFLNLIRSKFTINRSSFNNTAADAVDVDFCEGKINDSFFNQCGEGSGNGDCLDFSGSVVEIKNVRINGASDKAISIGERSEIEISNSKINNARIAVAAKDSSIVNIENLSILDSQMGLTVFKKKPEFGPAIININDLSMSNTGKPYIVEKDSNLTVDGKKIEPNSTGVKQVLYKKE